MKLAKWTVSTAFLLVLIQGTASQSGGIDKGYIFSGPVIEEKVQTLKTGLTLVDHRREGVMVSENPESPWHHAVFYGQGTLVKDSADAVIQEVVLCETIDPDGDMTWFIYWNPQNGPATLEFVVGTGKWEDIFGSGQVTGTVADRSDGYRMPTWEMAWEIDPKKTFDVRKAIEGKFTFGDKGLSFHGPHLFESDKKLKNGLYLKVSTQSGVLLSENPKAVSPRNFATCYDRGTTVTSEDKTINGDVMLLEDTDADGDVVWLIHVWWYGKGPGSYRFLGGTGKWRGIQGVGITRGMLRPRNDDHYMLKSEMFWNMPE